MEKLNNALDVYIENFIPAVLPKNLKIELRCFYVTLLLNTLENAYSKYHTIPLELKEKGFTAELTTNLPNEKESNKTEPNEDTMGNFELLFYQVIKPPKAWVVDPKIVTECECNGFWEMYQAFANFKTLLNRKPSH